MEETYNPAVTRIFADSILHLLSFVVYYEANSLLLPINSVFTLYKKVLDSFSSSSASVDRETGFGTAVATTMKAGGRMSISVK